MKCERVYANISQPQAKTSRWSPSAGDLSLFRLLGLYTKDDMPSPQDNTLGEGITNDNGRRLIPSVRNTGKFVETHSATHLRYVSNSNGKTPDVLKGFSLILGWAILYLTMHISHLSMSDV